MARNLRDIGVKEILIEGRVYSPRSSNSLSKLENEIELFSDDYYSQLVYPNIALLTAKA